MALSRRRIWDRSPPHDPLRPLRHDQQRREPTIANWQHRINIIGVLADANTRHDLSCVEEDCPDDVKEALAKEVEKAWPVAQFASKLREAKSIAAVNRVLDNMFDEADRSLVWCGM